MATTTNYSWTTPDDTDLVKDGAAAIRTLGSAIDTTVFTNAGAAIQKSIVDAAGDLIYATADDTPAILPIGTAGQILQVNAGATAPEWAAPAAGGGADWTLLNAGGTALTGAATITVSGISGADKIMVLLSGASSANTSANITVLLNADTGSNYYTYGANLDFSSSYSASNFQNITGALGSIRVGSMSANSGSVVSGYALISGCNASGVKVWNSGGSGDASASNGHNAYILGGYYNSASVITSVSALSSTGNFDAGTIFVYTSA
jgi:hypothetical protein